MTFLGREVQNLRNRRHLMGAALRMAKSPMPSALHEAREDGAEGHLAPHGLARGTDVRFWCWGRRQRAVPKAASRLQPYVAKQAGERMPV